MVLKVGLTGGIGSGKSTVAQIFETIGIPVYYADNEAKRLMNENKNLKEAIIKIFGTDAYTNNQLNKKHIGTIAFSDPKKLEQLNAVVHPATKKDGEEWMRLQTTPYAIHEAALIFEAGVNERLDFVIGVSAPQELRVKRTMSRDNATYEDVMKRINRQQNEEEKIKQCDFVLINDEQQLLIPQVLALHEKLVALSKQK
jgi:dephospho-CoA kinase